MSEELIQRLIDESDLRDLIHRYAFGLDREDWVLWRSVFADEVTIDMRDAGGGEPRPAEADKVVSGIQALFAGLEGSQHFMGSHRYAIDGDRAVITAHMRAEHWLVNEGGGDKYTMFGTYTDVAIRTDEGWKLTSVTLNLIRQEGNRSLMKQAAKIGAAKLGQG